MEGIKEKLEDIWFDIEVKTGSGIRVDEVCLPDNAIDSIMKVLKQELKSLEHYKATTLGLWATDRPDLIQDPKKLLFQITEQKTKPHYITNEPLTDQLIKGLGFDFSTFSESYADGNYNVVFWEDGKYFAVNEKSGDNTPTELKSVQDLIDFCKNQAQRA